MEEVQRLQLPLWSLVTAGKDQYFYECKVQAEVAKQNPDSGEKEFINITVVFDYEGYHNLVCNTWLQGMGLEEFPIEQVTVLAARTVNCGMLSGTEAPALDWIRERFKRRPRVQKYRLHQ
jgi:hypothetical protein